MNRLDFKIALRTYLKDKWYNLLNIAGLAMGLAAFIFVTLYVDHETGYDQWNKNVKRIYLVEREMPNGPSPYTPAGLAAEIKNQCPEVEEVGRTNTALFQIPFYSPSGRFLIKKWVGADYSIAKILGVNPEGFKLNPKSITPVILLSKSTADALFSARKPIKNEIVNMMSRSGIPITIAGVAQNAPGNTNFNFDCIGFSSDITSGKDQSYSSQIYQTFIMVKHSTDIELLSKKIDKIYREAALADTSQVAREASSQAGATIYLDALENLHLKPHYGSHVNNLIVKGLIALAIIILIVTGVNFTNLYIAQSNKRSKEIGIKKVNGVFKRHIVFQFLIEVFIQCLVALIVAFGLVLLGLPYFNQQLQVNLLISGVNINIVLQLFSALFLLTLFAGIYPALIISGFNPADVLRGNQLAMGGKLSWIRSSITVLQFTFAIAFIIILITVNQQVKFMKTDDTGFSAKQVVYIDNLGIFNNPKKFESVRERIKTVPGVKNVTVASNVPGGIKPVSFDYVVRSKAVSLSTISVDYEYFETLNIGLKEGKVFSSAFPGDSVNAVINVAAAKALNLKHLIGKMIHGRGSDYRIIGVIKDVRDYGFEQNILPAIYVMNNNGVLLKTQIMISAENNSMPAILKTLGQQWSDINKLDGDNFNYHFLDELYGKLFIKQEQLQWVLTCFSILAIFIAALGFFSSAAHSIRVRMREVAIRKVFGANASQLLATLSKPFFYIILIANLIAWPVSLLITNSWLNTFAYRVHLTIFPFVVAAVISILIIATTVCIQIVRSLNFNPAIKLKA